MSYSTLRRSKTYIVVPRDVDPQNFIYVPETRKVRSVGVGRCLVVPLLVVLVVGTILGVAGYFLHQYTSTGQLREWPEKSLAGERGELCSKQMVSIVRSNFHFRKRFIVTLTPPSTAARHWADIFRVMSVSAAC